MSTSTAWLVDGVEKLWFVELDENGDETGPKIRVKGIASENFTRNVNERTVLADNVTFFKDGKFQDYSGDVTIFTEQPDLMNFFRPGELTTNGNVHTFTEKASQAVKKFAMYVQSPIVAASGNATGKRWKRYPNVTVSNFQDPSTTGEIVSFSATMSALVKDSTDSPLDINWDEDGIGVNDSGDTTPPTVSSSTPADAASGVSVSTNPTVTYSEKMNVTSLKNGIKLVKSDGTFRTFPAPPQLESGPWTYPLDLESVNLDSASDYDLVIDGVRDVAGNVLATVKIISFATA